MKNTPIAAYPVCVCGHRHDHHKNDGDPRGPGCHRCTCPGYLAEQKRVTI